MAAEKRKAEELERQRHEAEAREREKAFNLAAQQRAEEAERQRLAEEKRKAEELERQRVEAETRRRQEAEERERREAAARKRETETRPAAVWVGLRPGAAAVWPTRTAHKRRVASVSSPSFFANNRAPLLLVGIAAVALLIGIVHLAYMLWPAKPEADNPSQTIASNQTPTPEASAETLTSELPSPLQSPTVPNERSRTPAEPRQHQRERRQRLAKSLRGTRRQHLAKSLRELRRQLRLLHRSRELRRR